MPRVAVTAASLLLAAAALFAQRQPIQRQGGDWSEVETGSFPSAGIQRLRVSSLGTVVANGSDGSHIEYKLTRRARTADESEAQRRISSFTLHSARSGGTLTLRVSAENDFGFPPRLELTVPRRLLQTHIDTNSGALQLYGLAGQTIGETGGGPIRVGQLYGSLQARTGGGPIEVEYVKQAMRCLTGGGEIRVKRAGAESYLETGGGEILVDDAGGALYASTAAGNIEVLRAMANVAAKTMGGLIKVHEAAGAVNAETRGGGIQVGAARGVRCESVAGGVRLRNVWGAVNVSTATGSILAEIMQGMRIENSRLQTAQGDITVVIPSNLAVTVQAMNELPGRYGRIVSEFSEIRALPVVAPVRGPVMAEGALNGGGPVLRLAAVQGTIFLRRRD